MTGELEVAIAADPNAVVAAADWTKAKLARPAAKQSIHLPIDPDVERGRLPLVSLIAIVIVQRFLIGRIVLFCLAE